MAAPYDVGSGQDHDASSYASLPGSGSRNFVSHNMTEMKSRASMRREVPGCNPSRWIYELLNNNFTSCDLFVRADRAQLDVPFEWRHQHRLIRNGNQDFATDDRKVLSTICLDCSFHFVFKMSWSASHAHETCNASHATWPMREDVYPWHHLVWAGSEADHIIAEEKNKYQPLVARENFVCVAPPCTFQLTLDVSEPRLKTQWVNLLLDQDAIRSELEQARKKNPERYEGATDAWATQAPQNMNTYLKNLLESDPDAIRNISKRNKRFAVIFGPRCFNLFRELEFEETENIEGGVDEGYFTPPFPPSPLNDDGHTDIDSYRGYIEDVRSEVQSLIYKSGPAGEYPGLINSVLHTDMGCKEIPNVSGNALVNVERYRLLGVLPNSPPEVVVNAYFRQWDILPSKKRQLVEALMAIANDCGDERLSDFAITQSSVFDSQLEVQGNTDEDGLVNQALIYLGLGPPNTYSVDTILEAFRKKLVDQPAAASTARTMLMLIAQASTDDNYQAGLVVETDTRMSYETSKTVLGIGRLEFSDTEAGWCLAALEKLQSTPVRDERLLYIQALDSLAEHTRSETTRGNALEFREKFLVQPPDPVDSDVSEVLGDVELPVGLHNIGNTCYLNSLLQYLYTVKVVREIVTNYDAFKLNLTDDSIQQRRLGGNKMEMDRGEAVVAQAFVHELGQLFHRLHTSDRVATRPSQRLANAVLLSTRSLLKDSETVPEVTPTAAGPKPPPLPARPSPAPTGPSTPPPDDIEMAKNSVAPSETGDISSRASSATLIDAGDGGDRPPSSHGENKGSSAAVSAGYATVQSDSEATQTDASGDKGTKDVNKRSNNDTEEIDVSMVDVAEETKEIDIKVLKALEHQKRSSGTDQQDVEEVIGSIISLLQAAIRPSHVDEATGIQREKIIETFFVTTVNYTKKFDEREYQHEISYDRSITAFPAPDGPCHLYDALGRNFDQQVLEESKLSRYTAIKSLPPILHVLIQRTQSTGSKNANPVVIPETIYLDRYMDAPHDSPEFQRRMEDWATASRLTDVKNYMTEAENFKGAGALMDKLGKATRESSTNSDAMVVDTLPSLDSSQDDWTFDGPIEDDFLVVRKEDSEQQPAHPEEQPQDCDLGATEGFEEAVNAVGRMVEKEFLERERTIMEHFDSSREHAYRLEAVICHRGLLHAGHYWVWIHDFDLGVWRCYNDANVTAEHDTEKVLRDLSNGGEPYYLCYVRDRDKQDWVSVPKRDPAPADVPDLVYGSTDGEPDSGTKMSSGMDHDVVKDKS